MSPEQIAEAIAAQNEVRRPSRRSRRLARLTEIRETGRAVAPAIIEAHAATPIVISEAREV